MRHSVEAAEWSDEREERYQREANAIACRAQVRIIQRDLRTFIVDGNIEDLLIATLRPKRLWYETWLCLRERFPEAARQSR